MVYEKASKVDNRRRPRIVFVIINTVAAFLLVLFAGVFVFGYFAYENQETVRGQISKAAEELSLVCATCSVTGGGGEPVVVKNDNGQIVSVIAEPSNGVVLYSFYDSFSNDASGYNWCVDGGTKIFGVFDWVESKHPVVDGFSKSSCKV